MDDILLSKKLTKVINEDFYIFEADNFLPLDFYLALEKSFPERSLLEKTTPASEKENYNRFVLKFNARDKLGESNSLNKKTNDFFIKNPEWSLFISLLTDKRFVYDVLDLCDKPISNQRGVRYSFRKKKYRKYIKKNPTLANKLANKLVNNIVINFMFSSTGPSEGLYPHTDSPDKLITLLLYFPEKNWRTEYHGETSFFKLKNNVSQDKKKKWDLLGKKNIHIINPKLASEFSDDYTVLSKSKYIPNMLAGFVKNDKSWHGIDPIVCPKNKFRRIFIVNITM